MEEERQLSVERSDSSSIDTAQRVEQVWTSRIQHQLEAWGVEIKAAAKKHNKAGKITKMKYRGLAIPAAIIPLSLSIVTQYVDDKFMIIVSIFLCLASILSTVNAMMDFGGLYQRHYLTEYLYNELHHKIEYILSQPKKDREASDVVMTEIRMILSNIEKSAPDV